MENKNIQFVKEAYAWSSEEEGKEASNVEGERNTYPNYGDFLTCWSPKLTGKIEFIEVLFDKPMIIEKISIYETYNPGALVKISCRSNTGEWEELWKSEKNVFSEAKLFILFEILA